MYGISSLSSRNYFEVKFVLQMFTTTSASNSCIYPNTIAFVSKTVVFSVWGLFENEPVVLKL